MDEAGKETKGVVTDRLWVAYVGPRIYIGLSSGSGYLGAYVFEDALEVMLQRQQTPEGIKVGVVFAPIFPSNEPIPRLELRADFVVQVINDDKLVDYYKATTHRSSIIMPAQGRIQFP